MNLVEIATNESITDKKDIIQLVRESIEYPQDKLVCCRSDYTPESIKLIKKYAQKDKTGGIIASSDFNLRLIFACDIYLSRCCFLDSSSGTFYSDVTYRDFGTNKNVSQYVDGVKLLEADVWDYIIDIYHINIAITSVRSRIDAVAQRNQINLIDMYLEFIADNYGKVTDASSNPLSKLLSYIEIDSPYFEAEETKLYNEYVFKVFDLWYKKLCNINAIVFTGRVHSLQYAMDVVPILIGAQNIGKSTFIDKIVGVDLRFFERQESLNIAFDKDQLGKLAGKLICEIGEIGGASFKDSSRIKEFLTKTVYEVRPPYGKTRIKIDRRWGGIGTANKNDILNDETGNRRYYPIEVKSINVKGLAQTDLPSRVLAYYWKDALKIAQSTTIEEYKAFLYREVDTIKTEEFMEKAEISQKSSAWEPEFTAEIEAFLMQNKEYIFTKNDIYYALYPPSEHDRAPQRVSRIFQNYSGKVLKELGFINRTLRYRGSLTKCWVHKDSTTSQGLKTTIQWYSEVFPVRFRSCNEWENPSVNNE